MEGLPPQAQEGRRSRPPLETAFRWPKNLFYYYSRKRLPVLLHDFSHGLTTCAVLFVLSAQRTHLPGADLLLLLQSHKDFLSLDCRVSKGSLQVPTKMAEVILITSGALPNSVSTLWSLDGIKSAVTPEFSDHTSQFFFALQF